MFIIYATAEKGYGASQEIGRVEALKDIKISVGVFSKDVVIEIGEEENVPQT